MKCARCNREMDKAAAWVGGHPVGPKCWEKMGNKPSKVPRVYTQHVKHTDQPDLFGEDDDGLIRGDNHSAASKG